MEVLGRDHEDREVKRCGERCSKLSSIFEC